MILMPHISNTVVFVDDRDFVCCRQEQQLMVDVVSTALQRFQTSGEMLFRKVIK
jgi:hypothetical protein